MHAFGLQTLAKLVKNDVNNVPLGLLCRRDADNTPLLKLIMPNHRKIGRLHIRALDGPVKFPTGPKDLMVKVEQIYKAFFSSCWRYFILFNPTWEGVQIPWIGGGGG